jgi:hypothetical protein
MLKKMSRNYFVKKNVAASIGYMLGVLAQKYTYPTAYLLATSSHDKDTVCKLARHLNLKVRLHKGEWQEQKRSINEIIKSKEYGQKKEIKD